jgi:hypothetical protein
MSDAYHALYVYALERGDHSFTLQHVVDAHAAQTAMPQTKAIAITFALVGLYLYVEKGYSGRQVQQMHMRMGRHKRRWPEIRLPANRGVMTAAAALAAPAGAKRDEAIESWARSVWEAFADSRDTIIELVREYETTSNR